MKTYLIERDIPNAGKLTSEQLKAISQKLMKVLITTSYLSSLQKSMSDSKICYKKIAACVTQAAGYSYLIPLLK